MATGKFKRPELSGPNVIVTVTVDEGLAGFVDYTAQVAIADLKALDTPLKRRNLIVTALKAVRDAALEQDALEGQLTQLQDAEVTL